MSEAAKGFVLNEAGFDLRALGRLAEAAQPMQAGLDAAIAQKTWENAARAASTISELYLTIGDVKQALTYAMQSVELSDRSGEAFWRMGTRTTLADALHQAGSFGEAETGFREAEEMQKQRQPQFPLLYSLQGYGYCDLLLSQGQYAEVQRRTNQTLEWAMQYLGLLDSALDNLSLGRAYLMQAREETFRVSETLKVCAAHLDRAVDGLRQAGQQQYIPLGLLARAEFHRITGALDKAQRDLDEAFSFATRGGMRLHEADCHLEYVRLYLAQLSLRAFGKQSPGNTEIASQKSLAMTPEQLKEKAREHLAIAKKMIEEMGYHRRDQEVKELEAQL